MVLTRHVQTHMHKRRCVGKTRCVGVGAEACVVCMYMHYLGSQSDSGKPKWWRGAGKIYGKVFLTSREAALSGCAPPRRCICDRSKVDLHALRMRSVEISRTGPHGSNRHL